MKAWIELGIECEMVLRTEDRAPSRVLIRSLRAKIAKKGSNERFVGSLGVLVLERGLEALVRGGFAMGRTLELYFWSFEVDAAANHARWAEKWLLRSLGVTVVDLEVVGVVGPSGEAFSVESSSKIG